MTYAEQMCGWLDRIVDTAMRHIPEGADRYYVEAMREQYKRTIRDVEESYAGREQRVVEDPQQRVAGL